jgi:DNA-binding LytR/AlgR family response regulator
MSLRIQIIEDEVLIAETIRMHLEDQGHEVCNISISYEEAVEAFANDRPDLAIIDIRLYGEKSGIDYARYLFEQTNRIPFIFLTSQQDRRIFNLAVETLPYGYLAKPIQRESLWTTVETAYRQFQQAKGKQEEVMTLFNGQQQFRVQADDIVFIESEHVYCKTVLKDGREVVARKSLKACLEELNSQDLFQCHRGFVINVKQVKSWDQQSVTLSNGAVVPVSRSKKDGLLALLE